MSPQSTERKEKRRKDLERKKLDRENRRNPITKDLHSSKYRQRIINEKEKGGSRNLKRDWNDDA